MKPLALLTLISVIAITAWNYAVNAIPLNGINTGAVSAKYATLITPAGYAFAIWGLIYLGLTAFAIYQILPTQNGVGESLDKIRTLLIINLLLNGFWLFAFHYEVIWASVLIMLGILGTLILIHLQGQNMSLPVWVNWTFQIYFGWITVATVVNVSLFFFDLNVLNNSLGWLIAILLIAAGIGSWVMATYQAYAYLGVLIWAFVAIGVKLQQTPGTSSYHWWPWGLAGLLAVLMVLRAIR